MPSLKEVRNRIVSVGSTMQITSAMKMVSAAKLKRAQDAVTQMRPYANKLKEILENVSGNSDNNENVYSSSRTGKNTLIIALSSNRGLAGAFNSNIIKRVNSLIKNELNGHTITVLPVGKKVNDAFRKTSYIVNGSDMPHNGNHLYDKLTFEAASAVMQQVMDAYKNNQFDKVILVYNQFKNAAVQSTIEETMLPIQPGNAEQKIADYIFEPSEAEILNNLIPLSLKTQFYKALLDSVASEHGARMTAMHKATDNAMAMQKELKITYNKARQASITKEILEIVGGAEALKN
ncbi:MAG: ATP synthase F1 subunit gamma [Sphingobacteriaceae bacterium]|nr:ATP synthase F1 subunit gamma [Sphingobacteriaceae bacterium]